LLGDDRVENAIPKIIGLEKAFELYQHPRFRGLMDEVKIAGKAVMRENAERVPRKDKPIVNAILDPSHGKGVKIGLMLPTACKSIDSCNPEGGGLKGGFLTQEAS
jgi:hypothetical protein